MRPGFAAPSVIVLALGLLGGNGTGPIVKGPWTQHVGPTSAVVRVEVSPPCAVSLSLDNSDADGGAPRTVEDPEVRALHSLTLTGLEPSRLYTFKVRAQGIERAGAVTTAPRDEDPAPFHFLAYGDNRTDDSAHAAVVRAMTRVATPFLVHTGDFVERGARAGEWQRFFDVEAPLLRERTLLAAVGNHELVDGAGVEFARYFSPAPLTAEPKALALEQLSGTTRWGNTRFFFVNGMVDYVAGPTRAWMDKALADADEEPGLVWRIIVVHHGPRSSGPHGDNAHFVDAGIPALWEKHKIDLVLSGHDHVYERGKLGALAYVVTGGGGAPLYRFRKVQSTSLQHEAVHHFVDVGVTSAALDITAVRVDGSTIEHCTLPKLGEWTCGDVDGGTPATPTKAASPDIPPDEPIFSRSRCGCEVVGIARDPRESAALWLALSSVVGLVVARRRRARPLSAQR